MERSGIEGSPIIFRFTRQRFELPFPNNMDHDYFVYILTDKSRSTLYIGVTNDLKSRIWQHRNPERASFTERYHCIILVFYEHFRDVNAAIAREKQLKGWRRAKKVAMIEGQNLGWEDLAADWW